MGHRGRSAARPQEYRVMFNSASNPAARLAPAAVALLGLLVAGAAAANPVQSAEKAAEKAASAVSGTVTKAEKAVKRGAKKAEGAIEQGVGAANRGADKVGAKVGLPPGSASAAQAAQTPR